MLALSQKSDDYFRQEGRDAAPHEGAGFGLDAPAQTMAARQDIFFEGDRATHIFEIVEGTVAAYRILPDGERHVVSFYFPGDVLGYCCGRTYGMSAHTITAVKLKRVPSACVERMMDARPEFARRLLQLASDELKATRDHLLCIAAKSAEAKMASFLLALSHRNATMGDNPAEVMLQMTRIDIADYLGLTVETVSRTLTKMKTAGVISLPRSTCVLLRDDRALEAMANS
jgi:CRP-like cAMP-binding protein